MKLISEILSELTQTSSRNEKELVLLENDSTILRKVLESAYNPFKMFNLDSQITDIVGTGTKTIEDSFVDVFEMLIELTNRTISGNAAVDYVTQLSKEMTPSDFEVVKNIIKKDLRCGISESTINKVFNDLVPTFEVQLAAKPERIGKMTYPCIVSAKMDGLRCVVVYDGEDVKFLSRSGKPIVTLDYMKNEVIKVSNGTPMVFDCEAMSATFNDSVSNIKRKTAKNTDSKLYVFDWMPYEDFLKGECNIEQRDRTATIGKLITLDLQYITTPPNRVAINEAEAKEFFFDFLEEGFEGAILKKMDAPYKFKRSDNWVKMKKHIDTLDLEIIGYEEGTGKNVGKLGAFILDYNGIDCKVGTGFSDKQREDFWKVRDTEMVGSLCEISAMEETSNKEGTTRLRHTVFKNIRSYKGSKV